MKGKTLVHITTVPQTLSFLSGQVNYMKKQGFNVYVISSPGEELHSFSQQEGVQYKEVKLERDISIIKDIISLINLIFLFYKLKPDIVHTHTPKASLLGIAASFVTRVPVRIYQVHGLVLETSTGYKRSLLMYIERLITRLSTHVFCVSESLKNQMIRYNLCRPEKVRVIMNGTINGIDARNKFKPNMKLLEQAKRWKSENGIHDNDIVIGFVARFTKDKGIEDLLFAWNKLKESYPNIKLILVGESDSRVPASENIIREFRSDRRVHFTGRVENTPMFYTIMDLLLHPSHREGFGQVIIEASAMEVPVVAYNVTGCKDAIAHNKTGILVPYRDKEMLVKCTEEYIGNPKLRTMHGKAGRERALYLFNPDLIWDEMHKEYKSALKK